MSLKSSSLKFLESVEVLFSHNIEIKNLDLDKAVFDFKQKKAAYYLANFKNSYEELSKDITKLKTIVDNKNKELISQILDIFNELKTEYKKKDPEKLLGYAQKLVDLSKQLKQEEINGLSLKIPKLPIEISDELKADIKEIEKCFNNDCLRSSIILCGRILETTLHRKYYEATGIDLLEKSPGIGLGKIIAKLEEKNIDVPSGLTQQIHLINQVRIFTVHKKQSAFIPTRQQAQAIILLTIDVLEKLFS